MEEIQAEVQEEVKRRIKMQKTTTNRLQANG